MLKVRVEESLGPRCLEAQAPVLPSVHTCQQARPASKREVTSWRPKVPAHCPLEPSGLILEIDCLLWGGRMRKWL